MSVKDIQESVLQLPTEQRRRFADWFYEHEQELAGPDYIHPSVKAEILRRRDEALVHPELLEPWEGTLARARQQLHEFRRQKTQSC